MARPRRGKTPFEIRQLDKEYSGSTFVEKNLKNASLDESFFNGVVLLDCSFGSVSFRNVELSEAKVEQCQFEHDDFTGADFVDSTFHQAIFQRCDFAKGEWRDASFIECSFIDCSFAHTTVALCYFQSCQFDSRSLESIQSRAVYFNVFSESDVPGPVTDAVFASRNFGIAASLNEAAVVVPSSAETIEQMCLLNNIGQFRVVSLVGVVTEICTSLSRQRLRRGSALRFFSKVLRVLTRERRISSTSLAYLEMLITGFGSTIDDQDLLMAAMAAVLEIHSALLTIAAEPLPSTQYADGPVDRITIYFSQSYGEAHVEALRDTLAQVADVNPGALRVDGVQSGSTFIEVAAVGLVSTAALLAAFNQVLRQARIAIRETTHIVLDAAELKTAVSLFAKPAQRRSAHRRSKPPALSGTVATAILRPEEEVPSIRRIRGAVRQHGPALIEMDEPADALLSLEPADGG